MAYETCRKCGALTEPGYETSRHRSFHTDLDRKFEELERKVRRALRASR